jgi:hypothetical protein
MSPVSLTCQFHRCLPTVRFPTYRQPVQKVHQDDDDEKDEDKEEDIAEGRVEGDISKLELADKHRECLDEAEAEVIEEGIVSFLATVVLVQEDVESKAEGEEEERVPQEEG